MLSKEELRLIRMTRLVPVFVLIVSILVILFISIRNDRIFESRLKEMEVNAVLERKQQIRSEVYRVHDYINEERTQTISLIKNDIKGRTNEAFSIINSIYSKNIEKTEAEITKMVIDALREIRFNDGRGYFFLYKTNGTVLMLPTLPHLENKDLWDTQDVKGSYIIRQVSNIATTKGEGFLTWWYNKPTINNAEKSFEKIGYVKHFEPYNWFVGTGEYIEDFESDLKVRLLNHIKHISLNDNGYIFVFDENGKFLSHYLDELIGTNVRDSLDAQSIAINKNMIDVALSGEGYISYKSVIQRKAGLPAEKVSFVKGYTDWGWSIGTGLYLSELNDIVRKQKYELIQENKQKVFQIILIGLFICITAFILSLLLSNRIRSRFEDYKNKVETKSYELTSLNANLEKTVTQRTKKLENTIADLKDTQNRLVETEKLASMTGLVAGVAHEMNTPFGVVITALSQTEERTTKFLELIKSQKLTKKDLSEFTQFSQLSYELINRNMEKAVNLIDSFKSLSPHLQNDELRTFLLFELVQNVTQANKENIDKLKIKLELNIGPSLSITSYFHVVKDVIQQLIQNSIIHAFEENDQNLISISATISPNGILIEYQDNGRGIPLENREKIFEPFFTTKRNESCTGLGMSILYNRVVHQLKGEINYNLATTRGFKVDIKLPV